MSPPPAGKGKNKPDHPGKGKGLMATVTSNLTRIHDLEVAPTLTSIGGGAGASANTDVFIQASQSIGRRVSNATDKGWWITDGAANDLSAAGVHLGMWVWVTHFGVMTSLKIRAGADQTNYDDHTVPVAEYPSLGGWFRVWLDISRTPEATGGSGGDEANMDEFALTASLPTVGGNADNVIMDALDHTTTGLTLTGTAGVFSDFTTADSNSTNRYGVITDFNGTLFLAARLTFGTSSSLVFTDSAFVIIFPDQSLVADTFMGITIDLQNASTDVNWNDGVVRSAGTKQGDLVVSGTSGAFDAVGCAFANLRTIDLTTGATLDGCTITDCDKLNQNGGTIDNCVVSGATTADGEAFIISDNPAAISNTAFTFSDGHAIEIDTTGTYTFTGNTFSGYGANDTNDAAIYNNSGGAVTINVAGGVASPTVRNGTGASTTVNNNVTTTLTGMKDNTEVRVYTAGTTTELAGIENATAGTADDRSFAFTLAAATNVDIRIHNVTYEPVAILSFSIPSTASSIPIQQRFDRNYENP